MRAVVLGLAAAVLLPASCAPGPMDLPDELDPVLLSAFAPASLRLNPLTRLETGLTGEPELAVYFELLDEWGHGTKAPGLLQVQLYRVGGLSPSLATLVERWEADLTGPGVNSAMYDVTRMYRVPLAELPGWLADRAVGDGEPARIRIRLFFRTIGSGGETVDLRDTLEKDV